MEIDLKEFVDDKATIQQEQSDSEFEEPNFTFNISDDNDDLFDDEFNRSTKTKNTNLSDFASDSDDNSNVNDNNSNDIVSIFSQNNNKSGKKRSKKDKDSERSFLSSTNDKLAHYQGIRERRFAKKRRRNADDPFIKDYDKWWQYINNSNDLESKQNELERKEQMKKRRRLSSTRATTNFTTLKISRVILRAIRELGWTEPTPVQSAAIPPALQGKDLLVNAVTGSGKTAAFMIPTLERLIFTEFNTNSIDNNNNNNSNNNINSINSNAITLSQRHGRGAASRVLAVTPTRELAAQCLAMTRKLAAFTKIHIALVVGGLSVEDQEEALRGKPDIIICTPGRMIDLVRNSRGITLDDIEILVLDEADRLLDMGFRPEIEELVSHVPENRQTLLFSATLSDNVLALAKFSMNSPVRISVDPTICLANHLAQEFVRIHLGQEKYRKAMLLSVCLKTFRKRTIVFCRTKVEAHNIRLIFGLMGLKAGELHGNMSQLDRLEALEAFRQSRVDFLLCTDVAARGLDISGIETVINIEFPTNVKTYIHRVGRTARAGSFGQSLTFVGEGRRRFLKKLISDASNNRNIGSLKSRVLNQEFVLWCYNQILEMKSDLKQIIREENNERELRIAAKKLEKSENILQFTDEILSKPKKTWFMNSIEKKIQRNMAHKEDLGKEFAKQLEYKIEQRKKLHELRKKKRQLLEMKKKGELESDEDIETLMKNEEIFGRKFKSVDKEREIIKLKKKKDKDRKKRELKFAKKIGNEALSKVKQRKRLERKENKTKYGNEMVDINDIEMENNRHNKNKNKHTRMINESSNNKRRNKRLNRIDFQGLKEFKRMKQNENKNDKRLRKRIHGKSKRKTVHAKRRSKR